MDPATLAAVVVAGVVRYAAGKAARLADAAIDDRLDRLYQAVQESLGGDRRGERTLHDLAADPADVRRQGRLESVLEGAIEGDPGLGGRLAALVEDLSPRRPAGGVDIRNAGPVAGGGIVITAGRDAAGRDLKRTGRDER